MTKTQITKITKLNKSIELQRRTMENLRTMVIDNGSTVAMCERIIATLESTKQLVMLAS